MLTQPLALGELPRLGVCNLRNVNIVFSLEYTIHSVKLSCLQNHLQRTWRHPSPGPPPWHFCKKAMLLSWINWKIEVSLCITTYASNMVSSRKAHNGSSWYPLKNPRLWELLLVVHSGRERVRWPQEFRRAPRWTGICGASSQPGKVSFRMACSSFS